MSKGATVSASHMRPRFHCHRLYPRYAPMVRMMSRVPGLTEKVLFLGGGLLQDQTRSSSQDPTVEDVHATSLVVCGVQRSGTTFLARAAEVLLDGTGGVWQSHDPFVSRDFLPHGIPVIVTLRDPLESAISKATYHSDAVTSQSLCRRLDLVTTWYRLIAHEPPHPLLTTSEFEEFTVAPAACLASLLGNEVLTSVSANDVLTRVELTDSDRDIDSSQTHIPHPERLDRRSRFEELADDATVRRHLGRALEAMERVRQNHAV